MDFYTVSKVFSEVEKTSSRTAITELLANLLKLATPDEAAIISYFSLGNLNPIYVGTQFNISDKSLYSVIARIHRISVADAKALAKSKGDVGLAVEQRETKNIDKKLSLMEVNLRLHEIHDISGAGSQDKKEQAIVDLLEELDEVSGKYIVRIILGKLRLGFSDMTLLDAFSWMKMGDKSLRKSLESAYNVCADIGHIIKVLKEDGIQAIESIKIQVGIPLRPAAAERASSAAAIIKRLGKCVAQPKLDGFRLQVHVDSNKKVHFYSRNLQDMSAMFPDLEKVVTKLNIEDMVAEGEAIAYDQETGTFLPFQVTVKRRRKHNIEKTMGEFPLKLFLFDLLYINGQSLLDESHSLRRQKMLSLFNDTEDTVMPIEEKNINTAKELEEYFEANISAGLEGLVVKKPDSEYKAGKRNFNWIKLKRQETGHLADTLDCVILGYYTGHGKRANFGIGAFLVGLYNDKDDVFETVAKIGTGLKDQGWIELKKMCDEIKVNNKPNNVECAKELTPDVWVSPEIVCAIRADEMTHSPLHTAGKTENNLGIALRFPRIMEYRKDKSAQDATTITEAMKLYKLQFKSL